VPSDFVPLVVEFKLNNIAEVPSPVSADQAPPPSPFTEQAETERRTTETNSTSERSTPPPPEETGSGLRKRGLSDISKSIVGDQFDENK
jgi:hypothetical protein